MNKLKFGIVLMGWGIFGAIMFSPLSNSIIGEIFSIILYICGGTYFMLGD